jgi:hypothetical protein
MGYLFRGYCLVCLSPFVSFALIPLWGISGGIRGDWFVQAVALTLIHVSVIVIQVLGLTFCFVGFRRNEPIRFHVIPNVFLILWGCFTIWLALALYGDLLSWSIQPQVRSLTILDHLQYETWVLKGFLWILAGVIFEVTLYIKRNQTLHRENSTHAEYVQPQPLRFTGKEDFL